MKRVRHLLTIFTLVTITITLYVPPGPSYDHRQSRSYLGEVLSVKSSTQTQNPVIREAPLGPKKTELRRENDALVRRKNGRESRRRGLWKLSARAEPGDDLIPEDDLTPDEDLDAFLDEEATQADAERPTVDEVQRLLTPEERAEFHAARLEASLYEAARRAARKAESEGRQLTTREQKNLEYGRERIAIYRKLRFRGLQRLVNTGNARPEVVAYWKRILRKNSEWARTRRQGMTEEERKAINNKRSAKSRKQRAATRARIKALEERVQNKTATKQEEQELAELLADRDRYNTRSREWYRNQPQEQREARGAKRRARDKLNRDKKRARMKELEEKVQNGTATDEEKEEWAKIKQKSSKKGTTDPSDNQTLQSRLESHLQDLRQGIPATLNTVGARSREQLGSFLHNIRQAAPTGIQGQNWVRDPVLPFRGGTHVGVPFVW